jgi:hypothetical protein
MAEWNPWYDGLAASQYSWFKVREMLEMNDVTHYVNVIEEFEEYSVNGCQIDDSYCRRTFVKKTEAVLPVFLKLNFFDHY